MTRQRIRIAFADFWPGFDPEDNYFTNLLRKRFDVEIGTSGLDFVIYSVFGDAHRKFRCRRVFYTGENVRPDFSACDYAFTFDLDVPHPGHFRLPLCFRRAASLVKPADYDARGILARKTGFCAFVYSNPGGVERNAFFDMLSKYKRVDAGGRLFNNIGGPVPDKIGFLRQYKFSFAFENDSFPGYVTEKIVDPMYADSLPIYWGNPQVHQDFNPRSFVSFYDHGSLEALLERVIAIDQDDELYLSYLSQPWLNGNLVPEDAKEERILDQFSRIVADTTPPLGAQWRVRLAEAFRARTRWRGPQRA